MNKKTRLILAAAAGMCAIATIMIASYKRNETISPDASAQQPAATSTEPTSTTIATAMTVPSGTAPLSTIKPQTQKQVDTNLSLVPQAKPSPTPEATSGCVLALAFNQTGGNLQTASAMHYTLSAKNLGDTICQSASISVYYATNEAFVSSAPQATADGYYWNLGSLAPGRELDISLATERTAPLAPGDATIEACLSAGNGSDACSNASTGQTLPQAAEATPQTQTATTVLSVPPGKELGVWVWTPISGMSPAAMQQIVNEAAENNFNAIYITVDEYLSIETQGEQAINAYEQNVATFIGLAAQKNIAVDAEAGARVWGQPGDTYEAPEIVSFVASYNQSHTQKFRGVQFDIEPYLLPGYNTNTPIVLTNYVQLIATLATQTANSRLPLTIVVPHFFDDGVKWTPEITVNGSTNYVDNLIFALLNKSAGNRMIVMAYRNFAGGDGGSISLAQTEVTEADATNVKVLVAQETGPVSPSYVTFNGTSRTELATQAAAIAGAFNSDGSFGGIAIDYLDPFLSLSK